MSANLADLGLGDWVHRRLEQIDTDQAAFWSGLKEHEFRLCRCKLCGEYYWPLTICPDHDQLLDETSCEWVPTSGRGEIFARTIVHQIIDDSFAAEVPFALVIVELKEGPLFAARLVAKDPYEFEIGHDVEVLFYDSDEAEHTLPLFRPRSEKKADND